MPSKTETAPESTSEPVATPESEAASEPAAAEPVAEPTTNDPVLDAVFDGLLEVDTNDLEPEPAPDPAPEKAPPKVEAQDPPPSQPEHVLAATESVPEPAKVEEPLAPVPTPQVSQPGYSVPLDPNNPEDVLRSLATDRDAYIAKLGTDYFTMTPEELEVVDSDPQAFYQNAGGRLLYTALTAGLAQLQKFVPPLIKAEMQASTQRVDRATSAEARFRTMWPQIGQEHDELVGTAVTNYRAANPKTSTEEAMKIVGQMVALQLGLSPQLGQPVALTAPSAPSQSAFAPAGTAVELGDSQAPPMGLWDALSEPID